MAVKITDLLDLDDAKLMVGYRYKGLLGMRPHHQAGKGTRKLSKSNSKRRIKRRIGTAHYHI